MVRFPFIGRLKKLDKNTMIRGGFCVVVVSIGCLLAGMLSLTPPVQRMELDIEDMLLRWGSNHHLHPQIALIGVDRLPQIDRFEQYARVANALVKAGAQVVAFGFSLEELDPQTRASALLAQLTQQNHQIIHAVRMGTGGESLSLFKRHALTIQKKISEIYRLEPLKLPPPEILQSASYIGHTAFVLDIDHKIRRVPLIVEYDDQYYPALSLVVAFRALNMPLDHVSIQPGKYIYLKRPTGESIRIPIDKRGRMRIHFAARQMSDFEPASFESIYEAVTGIFPRALTEFKDKIVFLGLTDAKREEPVEVPTSKAFYTVGIHANITNSILTGQFVREVPLWGNGIVLAVVVAVLTFLWIFSRRGLYVLLMGCCATFATFYVGAFALSQTGVLLNVATPTIGGLLAVGTGFGWRYYEKATSEAERYRKLAEALEAERQKLIEAYDIAGETYAKLTGKYIPKATEDIVAALRDIAQKLEEQNKEKELFVKALRHDLRTPLNTIEGFINRPQPDMKVIREAVTQAKQLVEQIQVWNTLDTMTINRQNYKLKSRILEYTVQLMRPQIESKGIHLKLQCLYDGSVSVDLAQVRRVIQNVLENAVKFTPENGEIQIVVQEDADAVQIQICDTGSGISPEVVGDIFKPYFVASRSGNSGSGLGLAISKKIIERHGGTITAVPGNGGRFILTLPKNNRS